MRGDTTLKLPIKVDEDGDFNRDIFTYSPLDTSQDGMRLVVLQPRTEQNIAISCRLVHVTFGEMPKYEALSYTWGDEVASREIEIDGRKFLVRGNLWQALAQLQLDDRERFLWIDAICIDQDDIPERNQQLRIMPHIYSRAQSVLVWLGYHEHDGLGEKDSCYTMSKVDYWHRVWIIQEIGMARRIKIHFGTKVIDWEAFIERIKYFPGLEDCIPLTLKNQMMDKYGDGYKLENLLKTHQLALCKDVRDKIYGFTGLANDTYGRLEMDYGKTPFQIWQDVVSFRNADTTVDQHDILEFARFVRDLLGGPDIADQLRKGEDIADQLRKEEEELERKIFSEDAAEFSIAEHDSVLCPAKLWGRVSCVGPKFSEMRSELRQVDRWKESIKLHVFDRHLRSVREESDLMLELLEDIDPSDLAVVRLAYGNVMSIEDSSWKRTSIRTKVSHSSCGGCPFRNKMDKLMLGRRSSESCFVLLDIDSPYIGDDGEFSDLFPGVALAPPWAREGDYICSFHQNSTAALIRSISVGPYSRRKRNTRVIGTSIVPNVRAMAASRRKCEGDVKPKFEAFYNAPLVNHETVNIRLNLWTLFQWLD